MQQYAPGAQGGTLERWQGTVWWWSRWWSLMMTKLLLDSDSPGRFHGTQVYIYLYIYIIYCYLLYIVPLWKFALWFLMFSVDTGIPFVPCNVSTAGLRFGAETSTLFSTKRQNVGWVYESTWTPKFSKNLTPKSRKQKCNVNFGRDFMLPMISDWMMFSHQVEANVLHPWKKRWVSKGFIGNSWKICRGLRFFEFIWL